MYVLFFVFIILAQYDFSKETVSQIIWCTKNLAEQQKCENLSMAVQRDRALFDKIVSNLTCLKGYSADECIHYIDREKAHITTLDAGDVFTAGRYNSLVPIMQEQLEDATTNYYAVAVIKSGTLTDVTAVSDLRDKKACFPWVGSLAGWIVPIYTVSIT